MVKHPIGEANESSLFGSLTEDEFYDRHSVSHSTEFFTNSRGLRQYTQWWLPKPPTKPIALITVLHGFTGEANWFITLTSTFLAESGFAVCAIDFEGHGLSEGLEYYIPDINLIVDDCIEFFDLFREKHAPGLPAFLYAESLGGAIALYITFRQKGAWDGLVLTSSLIGISRKSYPPWPMEHVLSLAAWLLPTWLGVPTRGTDPNLSFKEEWKQKLAEARPRRLKVAKLRLGTARELLRLCKELQGRFEEVEVPLLIVHGEEDLSCDPECVKALYNRASSEDKTIRMYPGMFHQIVGEPQESVDMVFGGVVEWIKTRALRASHAEEGGNGN
ncbi:caffeoylshikimate esterase-like [Rutidosis leptorrhynchoides]|uniref:caffeoylshikimate esterase-like n=1 Tax=Rutidosis leptorrhynchoides TaxID=125765 RepID=UPI003A9960BC